jgi:hypothetical protein
MGSSGGGGGNPAALMQGASPAPGLPVAGQGGGVGDPFEYGKFQNFLPEPQSEGENPLATGLRPEMFEYLSPGGAGGAAPGGAGNQIQEMRAALAKLQTPGLTGAGG